MRNQEGYLSPKLVFHLVKNLSASLPWVCPAFEHHLPHESGEGETESPYVIWICRYVLRWRPPLHSASPELSESWERNHIYTSVRLSLGEGSITSTCWDKEPSPRKPMEMTWMKLSLTAQGAQEVMHGDHWSCPWRAWCSVQEVDNGQVHSPHNSLVLFICRTCWVGGRSNSGTYRQDWEGLTLTVP